MTRCGSRGRPACLCACARDLTRSSACPSVLDKDLTDADDALGIAEIRLEGDSGEQTITLKGVGDFNDFPISFKWKLDPYVPPPATLKITGVKLSEVPAQHKRQKTKKNLLAAADHHEHKAGDPYLTFGLMEVGRGRT